MTRRDVLINWGRLALLRWLVVRGSALPAFAMAWLRALDRWAAERALDKPCTAEASAWIDRILAREEQGR